MISVILKRREGFKVATLSQNSNARSSLRSQSESISKVIRCHYLIKYDTLFVDLETVFIIIN